MTIINYNNILGLAALSCAPITALHPQNAVKEKITVPYMIADDHNDWVGCFEGKPQGKPTHSYRQPNKSTF